MRRTELGVRVRVTGVPGTVPREPALCLFRVAEESLRNVVRHAEARNVEVLLRGLDGGLQLAIQDDGKGFDPRGLGAPAHAGADRHAGAARAARRPAGHRECARPGYGGGGLVAVAARDCMSAPARPRILLADDHRMVAEGLKSLLAADFDLLEVVEDGRALVEAAERLRPDVIVADITMPHLNGIDALVLLKRRDPAVRVVFLTMHPDVAYARRALEEGAVGYVLSTPHPPSW